MWRQWWARRSRRRNPDMCSMTQRQCSASRSLLHRLVCHWSHPDRNTRPDRLFRQQRSIQEHNSFRRTRQSCIRACRWCHPDRNVRADRLSLRLTTTPLRKSCRAPPCNSACHWSRPHNNAPPDIVSLPLTTTPLRKSCLRRPCMGSRTRPQKKSSCRCCKADMRRYLGNSCRWRCMYQRHTMPDWDTAWQDPSVLK